MNPSNFLTYPYFPDNGMERGCGSSPVNDILHQMREIFKTYPKHHWFTYIANLLPLLNDGCIREEAYDRLEYLVEQETCLLLFHRLLVEEFVPGLVQTLDPGLAAAYPWGSVSGNMADRLMGFSCQREREIETGSFKDERRQRQCAAAFIDEELATRDGKAFIETHSQEYQNSLIALIDGLQINSARADAAALARDPDLRELADGFNDTLQLD